VRVAAIQLAVEPDEPAGERRERAFALVREEARRGAGLVVLPELWPGGFLAFDGYAEVAEPLEGPTATALAALARECGVALCGGSIVERRAEGLYNTALLFGRDGTRLAAYRKIHLWSYDSREAELLRPGTDVVTAALDGVTIGLATCFDLRFPELFRALVDAGAEAFVVVSAWPPPRMTAWTTMVRARAIENQAAIVACNCAGPSYLGASRAHDAWGMTLGELSERPGVLRVEFDADAVRAARAGFPILSARRL